MILRHSMVLNLSNKDFEFVKEKSKEAARCWNFCVSLTTYATKEYGLWLTSFGMWPFVNGGKFNLPTNTITGITERLDTARHIAVTCKKKNRS